MPKTLEEKRKARAAYAKKWRAGLPTERKAEMARKVKVARAKTAPARRIKLGLDPNRRTVKCNSCWCTFYEDQVDNDGFRNRYRSSDEKQAVFKVDRQFRTPMMRWICNDCLAENDIFMPKGVDHETRLLIEENDEWAAALIVNIERGQSLCCHLIPSTFDREPVAPEALAWFSKQRVSRNMTKSIGERRQEVLEQMVALPTRDEIVKASTVAPGVKPLELFKLIEHISEEPKKVAKPIRDDNVVDMERRLVDFFETRDNLRAYRDFLSWKDDGQYPTFIDWGVKITAHIETMYRQSEHCKHNPGLKEDVRFDWVISIIKDLLRHRW